MAFAPHTNTDVRNQIAMGVENHLPVILGQITNENGILYQYAENLVDTSLYGWTVDLPHVIYVRGVGQNGQSEGELRYARVLKTVAYVAVDEDEHGQPILEKWKLKKNSQYPTEWIYE
jgi:hypothetical protein